MPADELGWTDELKPYDDDAKLRLSAVPCPEQLDIEKRKGLWRAGAAIPPADAGQGVVSRHLWR